MRRNDLQNWTRRYTTRQWAELPLSNVSDWWKNFKINPIFYSLSLLYFILKLRIKIYYISNCSNNPRSSQTFQISSLLWLITEILTKEGKNWKNVGHLEKVIKNYYNVAAHLGGYSVHTFSHLKYYLKQSWGWGNQGDMIYSTISNKKYFFFYFLPTEFSSLINRNCL